MTTATPTPVQEAFAAMVESSARSQRDIAEEAGFERANVISLMKAGDMKVPIDGLLPVSWTPL
ncbi:MAG: hypothetical protein ACU0DT_06895 [Albimonas sp.]|uniref:hypothetical protein n=1 Tax=Albimonas sp. TaxID=1872425 RepID=UPI0040564434|tara:strand:- start:439 stop:627 length:189 start_codon:yes stop_codon:yes gene_type:complete